MGYTFNISAQDGTSEPRRTAPRAAPVPSFQPAPAGSSTFGRVDYSKDAVNAIGMAASAPGYIMERPIAALNSIGKSKAEDKGIIDQPIGRHTTERKKMSIYSKNKKSAVTRYKVLERFGQYTYLECVLETGRTHQIRVHMASIGYPILGDNVYGRQKDRFHLEGQTLHAKTIGFVHPTTHEYMEFEAPIPTYFQELLQQL